MHRVGQARQSLGLAVRWCMACTAGVADDPTAGTGLQVDVEVRMG